MIEAQQGKCSGAKCYTERELVLAQRRAWADSRYALSPTWAYDTLYAEATKRYPLPRVMRPRVVKDAGGYDWRIRDAQLEYRGPGGTMWHNVVNFGGPEDRWTAIRDLLANPTETVDADD